MLPSSPELYQAVFGHFAALPGLLNSVKSVSADTPEYERLSLLRTAEALHDDMMRWYQQYTSADGGLRAPILVTPLPPSEHYPFHSVYVYKDVLSATIITNWYAYVILLNRDCIKRLRPDCSRAEMDLEMAQAICMSVDFCSRSGYCGAQVMKTSLPIAHSVLPVEYRGWIEAWIHKFSEVIGI